MSPTPICSHILQSPNIFLHLSPQVVLDFHRCEFCRQVQRRGVLQAADFGPWVNVVACKNALRDLGTDAVEGFKGALGGKSVWAEVVCGERAAVLLRATRRRS